METFAHADTEARICVRRGVGPGDEVVVLQNEVSVVRKAAADVPVLTSSDAPTISEYGYIA